jgi:hypothetical protein
MNNIAQSIANNALASLSSRAPSDVLHAIKGASAKTGVNFAYMVQQAAAESNFDADAKAKTSRATGLYQFIESTWTGMIDKYGDKHGIDTEGKSRAEILELRNDPVIASNMAAEFASENERFLDAHWAKGEKEIGSTELYFAHFMGAGGASSFLKSRDENPLQEAALLFPKAAAANRNVFYDRDTGRAKTLEEVYGFFDKKFSIEDEAEGSVMLAEAPQQEQQEPHDILDPMEEIQAAQAHIDNLNLSYLGMNNAKSAYMNSMVFNHDNAEANRFGAAREAGKVPSNYQNLINNPIELMMLTQLDMPLVNHLGSKNSKSSSGLL